MDYFKKINTRSLTEMIKSAKENLYLCLPSLHPEISKAISELNSMQNMHNEKVKIYILIDFDANTFRQGYGDFKSTESLLKKHDGIKSLKDNRISFIICDNIGYYLFIESRTMIPADKETINAVRIEPVSIFRLKNYFFPGIDKTDREECTQILFPEEIVPEIPATIAVISDSEIEKVRVNWKKTPPLDPDYKRIVEFYSNKFQYVKFKFEGANLQYKKIDIPAQALPIMDATLIANLETRLNLFNKKDDQEVFEYLNDFKAKIEEIRKTYLNKVKSREENLLDKNKKREFESEVENLTSQINNVQSKTINGIAKQINESKDRLLDDLVEFFIANPKALFPEHPNLWENNNEYIEKAAKSAANTIIYKIKWPQAHLLVDGFKLIHQYSDITFEDLKSNEFVAGLIECGLINEAEKDKIAKFGKGISINSES